ncbi:dUTP diphosphatase [Oceanobacillus caeni]|uniref:dUTP diphosphatase n=1 Tax=Oceanobacillus caeni TaxID=405946 RepID=UPI002149AC7D|nr:dUTP diphosphatase [Oceanobacillus caeni]MCR1833078.1 dUTP diphosphatase [Oceanobacillus caeni]
MNLQKLFEIQAGLDYHIVKEKGLEGQDLLDEKILALQVELGELANELPEVFKFWSNKKNDYEKALKEYVDCLHFFLSIGLDLGYNYKSKFLKKWQNGREDITEHFNFVFWCVAELKNRQEVTEWDYFYMFGGFLALGELLEFTWEQIETAYLEKNKINHERQINGY